jgi:hypothetical protein
MQQQQSAEYDLLAVFSDESKADAAETKLHKEGFGEDEVYRLTSRAVVGGEFREHGPNRERRDVFLQTSRSGPNLAVVVLLAVLCGVILGGVLFAAHFAFTALPEIPATLGGVAAGIVLGIILGLFMRGRVRGAIGQDLARASTANKRAGPEERNVIAVRLPDAENIARKSRARAILLNNGGKIDRSVGR